MSNEVLYYLIKALLYKMKNLCYANSVTIKRNKTMGTTEKHITYFWQHKDGNNYNQSTEIDDLPTGDITLIRKESTGKATKYEHAPFTKKNVPIKFPSGLLIPKVHIQDYLTHQLV